LDVAGKSIYCDETGGDYFDFIEFKETDHEKLGVVVGDVAGHGVSSALLMATVRSALRQRIELPGSISQVMADVNKQLVGDFAESGQFVTLFYLVIDQSRKVIEWVRAGHDPAIYYNPAADLFIELDGFGMALGVEKDSQYEENRQNDFSRGGIIVLGTDGIWETRNEKGQMFGRTALCDVIRKHSAAGAGDIMEASFEEIENFSTAGKPEDDVTLVVIKFL
jgi:sigma-B regulation protein RsbU (phosphoserine phosphatase)